MFLYGFSSCTCLYEWLSIFLWVFVMYMFLRMTIHIILMGFPHVHVCTNDYPFPCVWVFVMHISVGMTIHFFWMSFRHAHFCTNDYPFLCVWVFVMHISVGMTIHFFMYGFSSWTFLYEWLCISFGFFFMYIFLRMTILFSILFPIFLC